MTMLRRFARAQEGKLRHQSDVVAEAGELGTLAAVLAMMKKCVPPRELSRLLAPKGGIPEMRVGRILAKCDPLDHTTGWPCERGQQSSRCTGCSRPKKTMLVVFMVTAAGSISICSITRQQQARHR